ncbi:uncharacterized protein LOC119728719 isoform X2 [Patiria miniata]|nr:uncharacterized protein LOC119728719 isoform X2 [Patiria miniata]XP_038056989.1 uncharacterized protein LOC119728719 isoform X2 [Patiria miniata]
MIQHAGAWRTVCYDGWTHEDASTACRQLGYSQGAMITRANDGTFAGPAATPTLRSPGCTASHHRLTDCTDFQYQENLTCTSEVDLSCYANDFNGCFSNTPQSWNMDEKLPGASNSIESCLDFCRSSSLNPRFAALAESRCFCGSDEGNMGSVVSKLNCALPCSGDPMEACGSNTNGYFAIWPVTVGAPGGAWTTATGCLYSRDFPARYQTTRMTTTDEYTVTLPTRAYISLMFKSFDIYSGDSVKLRDKSAGSAMTTVDLTPPSSPGTAVIPLDFRVSRFSLLFVLAANSPSGSNYGFVICYESLVELPTEPPTVPSTVPPTVPATDPPTDPPIDPPTIPLTAPQTDAPQPQTLPPVGPTIGQPTDSPDSRTTPSLDAIMSTDVLAIDSTSEPPTSTIDDQDTVMMCPAYQGAPLENRTGSETMTDILLINTGNPFNCSGFLTNISYFSAGDHALEVSIWQPNHNPDTDEWLYSLSARAALEGAHPGIASVSLNRDDWLPFGPGDVMGIRFQTSPLVFSDVISSDEEATLWMRWNLEDGSVAGSIMEKRDTVNATALNRTYSISATLRDKAHCLVPNVPNIASTDAIVPYVYEGDDYLLDCRAGYRPVGGRVYMCQSTGRFDRNLECQDDGSSPLPIFTVVILCVVVLVLICLTVFVITCMMMCCSSGAKRSGESAPANVKMEADTSSKSIDQPDAGMGDTNSMDDNQFLINIDSENGEPDEVANPVAEQDLEVPAPEETSPLPDSDAHGMENGIANPEANVEGTPVMENPVHDSDVSVYRPFVYSTPTGGLLAEYPPRTPPPAPPVAPPPPPVGGTNTEITPSNPVPLAPVPPPLYLQPTIPVARSDQPPPDSPDTGSNAALISEDQSDTLSNPSQRGYSSRRIGQSISSRLSVFEN